jgi:TOBE domain
VVAGAGAATRNPQNARVLLRPDWLRLDGPFAGTVAAHAFRGSHTDYELIGADGAVHLQLPGPPQHAVGAAVSWGIQRAWVLPGDPGPRAEREADAPAAQPSAVSAPG